MAPARIDLGDDPFLVDRDKGEATADAVMKAFMLKASPPAAVYQQTGGNYTLIVPSRQGARLLTVPAANEADFTFHGNPGAGGERLADFIAATVAEFAADHVRLPLLSETQAVWLGHRLAKRQPNWIWNASLAAIAPVAAGTMRQTRRFRRAMANTERDGFFFDCTLSIDPHEVNALHVRRWGPANRGKAFFDMLNALLSAGCAEFVTARRRDGTLVAAQLDILGTATRHYYYSISDTERATGCGTAVLGISWSRFAANRPQTVYSFGRGAERYKYQYATGHRALFELRGFFAPA